MAGAREDLNPRLWSGVNVLCCHHSLNALLLGLLQLLVSLQHILDDLLLLLCQETQVDHGHCALCHHLLVGRVVVLEGSSGLSAAHAQPSLPGFGLLKNGCLRLFQMFFLVDLLE